MSLRAQDVFTPGSYPVHTYVERSEEKLEQSLRDALSTPGQIVSLSGPSKSGKTVLVERVAGRDNLITVPGAGVESPNQIWEQVLDWMGAPVSTSRSNTIGGGVSGEVSGKAGIAIPGLAKAGGEVKGGGSINASTEGGRAFERRGLTQVVEEISNSDFVVLLDDFHYMAREVQAETAKSIKEAVRLGVKICTAAVRHRGDDVVRANPELRGRVRAVDLNYWNLTELASIAEVGFGALNAKVEARAIEQFAREAAGSPQLMQLICLNACFVLGMREKSTVPRMVTVADVTRRQILEQTSASTDFRSLVDVLDDEPRTRGTERKTYQFWDDSQGDVYRCVLKAVAMDPPRLSFSYDELTKRTNAACRSEGPVGSSVTGTCLQMSRLAQERFPTERVIDWDEQKTILDIPDPYLLFYLRWSGRLVEPEG